MSHSMTEPKDLLIMMIIMFISGLLSSMNVWVDKFSDIRFHMNDIYMALLMCGWCLIFMGIYYINPYILLIGIIITMIILYFIRNQVFIGEEQYIQGMIPHHSMAILMSKQLIKKLYNNSINLTPEINELSNNIIKTQEDEISYMKFIFTHRDKILEMNKYKNKYKYKK
jgi:hypothetical protein